jgi:hypothetical protein
MESWQIARRFVYHSPQYPGFTCWCGLWSMPDGSTMCCFTQATGPLRGRPQAPPEVRRRLDWPPSTGAAGTETTGEAYDMTGLDLANVHLRSTDAGDTWTLVARDHFRSCMNGITGEAETALADGSLLRAVWGPYLPYDRVPYNGYLERSLDSGANWGPPQVIYGRHGCLFWPKRIRVLRDGRVLAGGGLLRVGPANDTRRGWFEDSEPVLFVADARAANWGDPIPVVPAGQQASALGISEEFDWAELDNGDLLLVLRADAARGGPCRLQTRLQQAADRWVATKVERAPFPPSGHPELLATREGAVLHLATTGVAWTQDAGATWSPLEIDDGLGPLQRLPATGYYPRSLQLPDGQVLVVGHVGGDDAYGTVDQSIVAVRFGLRRSDRRR